MGLRTASVRRPTLEVMAPALTEATQAQTFKCPAEDHPIKYSTFYKDAAIAATSDNEKYINAAKIDNAVSNLNTLALKSGGFLAAASAMGDVSSNNDEMGVVQKPLESLKNQGNEKASEKCDEKPNSDDELTISNFSPENVEDIMNVITSIATPSNVDEEFPVNNLSFLGDVSDVDMLNISIEEPQQDKLAKSKDTIALLRTNQAKLERRLHVLRRKVRMFQAHNMGQHISKEIRNVFETVDKGIKEQFDRNQPSTSSSTEMYFNKIMGYKSVCRKLEMTVAFQSSSWTKPKQPVKYFGSGSTDPNPNSLSSILPSWPPEAKLELSKVAGALHTQLKLVQEDLDSEATESSSGGESCDEFETFNNPHQQYLSIQKRALWKYLSARAAVAARWTWLQTQIADLEHRIRRHGHLYEQMRRKKGRIQLAGEDPAQTPPVAVNGYRGQLPGNSKPVNVEKTGNGSVMKRYAEDMDSITTTTAICDSGETKYISNECFDNQCARTRPVVNFKRRKLLQTCNLHLVSRKASRPSTVRCNCTRASSCAICTGRPAPTVPRDSRQLLSNRDVIALSDPSFHPVVSLMDDSSLRVHAESVMKIPDWQNRSTRMKASTKAMKSIDRTEKGFVDMRNRKFDNRRKYARVIRPSTVSALSAKIKNKMRGRKYSRSLSERKRSLSKSSSMAHVGEDDEEIMNIGNNIGNNSSLQSPNSSPLLHTQTYNRRPRASSYDIDNIIIPHSVAASTRVEKLPYKEILTPKWRIAEAEPNYFDKYKGITLDSNDPDYEDPSEEAVAARHEKCEIAERKRFLSYLKPPFGNGRPRSHRRTTDSQIESNGGRNTPDAMSPSNNGEHQENNASSNHSPMQTPPATPSPAPAEEVPSIACALRRRRGSQSRRSSNNRERDAENQSPLQMEVALSPYQEHLFPLDEETWKKVRSSMPEDYEIHTNFRAQDSLQDEEEESLPNYMERALDSPGSESTESAIGEEDPNDPEWVDVESTGGLRDRHHRR